MDCVKAMAFAGALALSTAAGAQKSVNPADQAAVASLTEIKRDAYKGSVTVKGPEIPVSPKRAFTPPDTLQMWASKAPGDTEMALYVSLITDSREGRDYRTAASGGTTLRVQTEAPKVRGCSGGGRYLSGSCSYLEGLWIIFDDAMLEAASRAGFSFAVYGEGPRKEFYVPPGYFAAFKAAADGAVP
jgi:hypothetical protein